MIRTVSATLTLVLVALAIGGCAAPGSEPGPMAAPGAGTPRGELRIGTGISLPDSLIVTEGSVGYNMITYGAGETLMRLTPEQQLEPWLAEDVSQIDELTWQVVLRQGVRFHDGSTLTAASVAESLQRSWENLPAAANFLPATTQVEVIDDTRLHLRTPQPVGNLLHSLANWNFVIHKPPQNAISILTGMYRPVYLEPDQELALEHFADYWGGPAPLERVLVRQIPDANARSLALQSGDLDMLTNVPPEVARGLPADIERTSVPGTRMHYVILNHTRPPFNDPQVRAAAASAIDREELLAAALDGQGAVATNMYPPSVGIELVPAQTTDLARAQQLLDQAGWIAGPDGVREQDGQRLQVRLYSYPGRPELTQMAVAIQAQLQAAGFEVQVEEVRDIVATIEGGDFDASMFSVSVSSDSQYMPGITLVRNAPYNYGGYFNARLEALFEQLRAESDPLERQAFARQLQEIVAADTPNLYLVVPPLITAFRSDTVAGYTPHPDDLYLITRSLAVRRQEG